MLPLAHLLRLVLLPGGVARATGGPLPRVPERMTGTYIFAADWYGSLVAYVWVGWWMNECHYVIWEGSLS